MGQWYLSLSPYDDWHIEPIILEQRLHQWWPMVSLTTYHEHDDGVALLWQLTDETQRLLGDQFFGGSLFADRQSVHLVASFRYAVAFMEHYRALLPHHVTLVVTDPFVATYSCRIAATTTRTQIVNALRPTVTTDEHHVVQIIADAGGVVALGRILATVRDAWGIADEATLEERVAPCIARLWALHCLSAPCVTWLPERPTSVRELVRHGRMTDSSNHATHISLTELGERLLLV